jgi:hypothetical protein
MDQEAVEIMEFTRPWIFLVNIPLLPAAIWWWWIQYRAILWLRRETSSNFQRRFTVYRGFGGPVLHLLVLMILINLLVAAAAGPYSRGIKNQDSTEAAVMVLLDASFSMVAQDVALYEETEDKPVNRFDQARRFALDLVAALPDTPVGLISFSGGAVIHAPPTTDHHALESLIRTLTLHSSENTGSRFESALEECLHLAQSRRGPLTAVMLSDGEIPHETEFEDMFPLMNRANIVVHTIAFGSTTGAGIVLYDPNDILAGKEKPAVVREAWTKKDLANLRLIAGETGGECFNVANGAWTEELVERLRADAPGRGETNSTGADPGFWFVLGAISLFVVETVGLDLVTARRWRISEKPWLSGEQP